MPELRTPEKVEAMTRHKLAIRMQQAEKDFKVAEYWEQTNHPGSAYFSYEIVRRRYPGTKYEEEALFSLHQAYVKLKEPTRAQETLRKVIERLPGTPAAERAQRMLGS